MGRRVVGMVELRSSAGETEGTSRSQESWVDAMSARLCGGTTLHVFLQCNCAFARSAAVSEAALNIGGELFQLMVRDSSTARSWGSPSWWGIRMASWRALFAAKRIQ